MSRESTMVAAESTVWTFDPAHTQVEFAVKHMMFTTVRGQFSKVEGRIEVDGENPERSTVQVKIDPASIDTRVVDRDQHLRSGDFLNVEEFGELTFVSERIEGFSGNAGEEFRIVGDLTIRGESREITLDALFEGEGTDPWGGTRLGFSADAKLDRRDFGLTWNQALETGGVLVGNEVRIHVEAQAVPADAGE